MTTRAENGDAILERRDPKAIHFYGSIRWPATWGDPDSIPGIACHKKSERWTRDFREVTCDECRMARAFQVARRHRADSVRFRLVVIEGEVSFGR